jgi:hypothetical protein
MTLHDLIRHAQRIEDDGHEIRARKADLIFQDQLVELRNLDDDEWGDPAEWGPEWDTFRWELGPEPSPPDAEPLPPELAPVDPDPDDVEWLNGQPTLDDWAEYRAWSRWVEMKDRERMITEDDIRANGLPI